MKTSDIRAKFIAYFTERGHKNIAGSSLVPGNDATLLFTNSGMVQFKDIFLGNQPPAAPRAVTAQRCVRAGGKHNDLENVGYTARHHTFFEMLGNFSFGDYFKRQAINHAWELLTVELKLPPEKLWVTVFEDDDEARDIWLNDIGVPESRLRKIGAADNFWQMGDTGPCGPCSEVFYDHGDAVEGGPPGSPEQEGDRFVEIWNLVFMQFNRAADGELTPLPKPSVDTGMGLERIAAVLQGVHSNYEIDLFRNLIQAAADALGVQVTAHHSLQVIADHIRSTAFLIVDGVTPSNEGRGYVLRRIIRRAVRHGYQLGCRAPFMHKLVPTLVAEMGEAYPELSRNAERVARVLELENERFNETLEQGLKILDKEIAALGKDKTLSGDAAFRLYDTFGFPLDLTADVARERGVAIDTAAFDACMAEQRTRARAAGQFGNAGDTLRVDGVAATKFIGHQNLTGEGKVLAILTDGKPQQDLTDGAPAILALDQTPFYAESGGQVGDRGAIEFDGGTFEVSDTQYLANKVIGHIGELTGGTIKIGAQVKPKVAPDLRTRSANNHSATHLLHAALKAVLGEHVQQKGSLVEPRRLRFDFSHSESLTTTQLETIQQWVNRNIRANTDVAEKIMDLDEAKSAGAEALFGEKYDSQVRTIRFGDCSFELCGGTHVARSGDIGFFQIIAESGIAAGVRRIEAITGEAAERWLAEQLATLTETAATLKTPAEQLGARVKTLLTEQRENQKQIQNLQTQLASGGDSGHAAREIAGIKVIALRQDDADAKTMRMVVDQWKQKLGSGVVLVAGVRDGKVTVVAGVTKDQTHKYSAGDLIRAVVPLVDGSGGGKPDFAQGGGEKVSGVEGVLEAVYGWVEN